MHTNMKRGLRDDYCASCNETKRYKAADGHEYSRVLSVEYPYDHPERYDGVSEWRCPDCGRREGRWTGAVLTDGSSEPRYGEERDEVIHEEQLRFEIGSQPR
jgi:hypothetical protein